MFGVYRPKWRGGETDARSRGKRWEKRSEEDLSQGGEHQRPGLMTTGREMLIRLLGASETDTPRFQTQPHHLLALCKFSQF